MKKRIIIAIIIFSFLISCLLIVWYFRSKTIDMSTKLWAMPLTANTAITMNFAISQKQEVPIYAHYIGSSEAGELYLYGKLQLTFDGKEYRLTFLEIFDDSILIINQEPMPISKLMQGKTIAFLTDETGQIRSLRFASGEDNIFKEMSKNILSLLWWRIPKNGKSSYSNERFVIGDVNFLVQQDNNTVKKSISQINRFYYLNFLKASDVVNSDGTSSLSIKNGNPAIIKGNYTININNFKQEMIYQTKLDYKFSLEKLDQLAPNAQLPLLAAQTEEESYEQVIDLSKPSLQSLEGFAAGMDLQTIAMIIRLHNGPNASYSDPTWFPKAVARLIIDPTSHNELQKLFEKNSNIYSRALILDLLASAGEERFSQTLLDLIRTTSSDPNYAQYLQRLSFVATPIDAIKEYLKRESDNINYASTLSREDQAKLLTFGSMISKLPKDEAQTSLDNLTALLTTSNDKNKVIILTALANGQTENAAAIAESFEKDPSAQIRVAAITLASSSFEGKNLILRLCFDENTDVVFHALTELKKYPLDINDFEYLTNNLEDNQMDERNFGQLLTICEKQFSPSSKPIIEYFKKSYNSMRYSEGTKTRIRDLIELEGAR